jgi:predicted secreted protein
MLFQITAKPVNVSDHALSWKKHLDTEGADWRMIKADKNQMEGLHPISEIPFKVKFDVIRVNFHF